MGIRAKWILQRNAPVFENRNKCDSCDESSDVGAKGDPSLVGGCERGRQQLHDEPEAKYPDRSELDGLKENHYTAADERYRYHWCQCGRIFIPDWNHDSRLR